jgi:hypothetical protein
MAISPANTGIHWAQIMRIFAELENNFSGMSIRHCLARQPGV